MQHGSRAHALDDGADGADFVEAGDDDGELHGLRTRYEWTGETEAHFRRGIVCRFLTGSEVIALAAVSGDRGV
jgi:hypothetical protein